MSLSFEVENSYAVWLKSIAIICYLHIRVCNFTFTFLTLFSFVIIAAASGSELLQPPPLAYKKWGLVDQEQIMDYTPCG